MSSKSTFLLCAFILFALSACVGGFSTDRMIARGDVEIVRNFDSGQYLQSANDILHFLNKDASAKPLLELGNELMIDGPILPPAAAMAISVGQLFKVPDWRAVLFMQTIFQAITSALVFILAYRLTSKIPLSLFIGLTWAFYPPGIIGSERLLTETLSIDLLLVSLIFVSIILESKQLKLWPYTCLGLVSILLVFTKPALAFAIALPVLILIVYLTKSLALRPKPLLALVVPALTCLSLFAYASQATTGKISLLPQRMPILNVLAGNDLRTDGLAGVPQRTTIEGLENVTSPTRALSIMFAQNPVGILDLMLRKLPRIFAEPWNDYRQPAVFSRPSEIRLVHQSISALGLIGLTMAFIALVQFLIQTFKRSQYEEDFHTITAITICASILGHLSFIFFEGVPRYGITVAPMMMALFAWALSKSLERQRGFNAFTIALVAAAMLVVAGNIATIENLLKSVESQTIACVMQIAIYLILATVFFVSTFKCAVKCIHGQNVMSTVAAIVAFTLFTVPVILSGINESINSEIVGNLSSQQFAEKRLDLGKGSEALGQKPNWALLLIDGDKHISSAEITVNGFVLKDKATNIYDFYHDRYPLVIFIARLASFIHTDYSNVRQWRAVQIPLKHLNLEGINSIKVSPGKNGTAIIYGDFETDSERAVPGYRYISQSRLFVSSRNMDWRQKFGFLKESETASYRSTNKSGQPPAPTDVTRDLGDAPGTQKGQWRILLTLGIPEAEEDSKASQKSVIEKTKRASSASATQTITLVSTDSKECGAEFPLLREKEDTHVAVELEGEASIIKGDSATVFCNLALCGKEAPEASLKKTNLNSLGQPKPEYIVNNAGGVKLQIAAGKPTAIKFKTTYPLNVVQGFEKTLRLRFVPVASGQNIGITFSKLKLTTHLERLPDLGQQKILTF